LYIENYTLKISRITYIEISLNISNLYTNSRHPRSYMKMYANKQT